MNPSAVLVDTVLLKVASRCNIDCSYCYVYHLGDKGWQDMPALMSEQTVQTVGDALRRLRGEGLRQWRVIPHQPHAALSPEGILTSR